MTKPTKDSLAALAAEVRAMLARGSATEAHDPVDDDEAPQSRVLVETGSTDDAVIDVSAFDAQALGVTKVRDVAILDATKTEIQLRVPAGSAFRGLDYLDDSGDEPRLLETTSERTGDHVTFRLVEDLPHYPVLRFRFATD